MKYGLHGATCRRLAAFIFAMVMMGNSAIFGQETSRVAYVPISAETLVPITTESIWQSECGKILDHDEAKKLRNLLTRYLPARGVEFDELRVRLGVELNGDIYYVDADLVVYSEATKESKRGSPALKNALRHYVEEDLFKTCGLGKRSR